APLVGNRVLLVEHAHHGVTAIAVELGAIGVRQADHIAGELDDGTLQAQADAEERDLALASIADSLDLALAATIIEAAGNQDTVHAAQDALGAFAFNFLGLDLANDYARCLGNAGMIEGLINGFVGVVVTNVLADNGDGHLVGRVLDPL